MTLKGWRTLAFNALSAIIPILEMSDMTDIIPAEWMWLYSLAIVLGNIGLRFMTTTAVGRKG